MPQRPALPIVGQQNPMQFHGPAPRAERQVLCNRYPSQGCCWQLGKASRAVPDLLRYESASHILLYIAWSVYNGLQEYKKCQAGFEAREARWYSRSEGPCTKAPH